MNRTVKSVAIIVLFLLIAPALVAASDCIRKSLDADPCQPGCPMMEMGTEALAQVLTIQAEGPCCTVSSGLPVNKQAAMIPQTWMTGTVQMIVSAPHVSLLQDGPVTARGTAPPAGIPSHQAVLCTFLV